MSRESLTSIRYNNLLDQLSRFIIPTGGKAKFILTDCERDFINDMAKIKDLPIDILDSDPENGEAIQLRIHYADNIIIVLTTAE